MSDMKEILKDHGPWATVAVAMLAGAAYINHDWHQNMIRAAELRYEVRSAREKTRLTQSDLDDEDDDLVMEIEREVRSCVREMGEISCFRPGGGDPGISCHSNGRRSREVYFEGGYDPETQDRILLEVNSLVGEDRTWVFTVNLNGTPKDANEELTDACKRIRSELKGS